MENIFYNSNNQLYKQHFLDPILHIKQAEKKKKKVYVFIYLLITHSPITNAQVLLEQVHLQDKSQGLSAS